jgi:hypothetical protein
MRRMLMACLVAVMLTSAPQVLVSASQVTGEQVANEIPAAAAAAAADDGVVKVGDANERSVGGDDPLDVRQPEAGNQAKEAESKDDEATPTVPPLLEKLAEAGDGSHEDPHEVHAVRQHHAKVIVDEQGHITLKEEEELSTGLGRRSSLRHPRRNAHPAKAALVLIVLMCMLIAGQIGIVQWKLKSPATYTRVSLAGLWILPFGYNLYLLHWRFTTIWFIFTMLVVHITLLATAKPLHPKAPQVVYRRLDLLYRVSSFTSSVGFGLIMMEFLGFRMLFHLPVLWVAPSGITLSFYGLYFGMLCRDFAEVAASRMCNTIGVHKYETPPLK